MSVVIVTGCLGLVGAESSKFFLDKGFTVIGIDNDMRKIFFGHQSSGINNRNELKNYSKNFIFFNADIRSESSIKRIFRKYGKNISLVIHAAAQPSHDWAATNIKLDFEINAWGTLNILNNVKEFCNDSVFIMLSTNKVYGDAPNTLRYIEQEKRFQPDFGNNPWIDDFGFTETLSIDNRVHSFFGVSKTYGDLLAQEFGKNFGLKTTIFRGGCLSGPMHNGAELHGFLSYLVKCAKYKKPYTIFGYKGKQVRDNLHSKDLVECFWLNFLNPKSGEVYNIGGSSFSNISILEAIEYLSLLGYPLNYKLETENRVGDHKWWISSVQKFIVDYPSWKPKINSFQIIDETIESLS